MVTLCVMVILLVTAVPLINTTIEKNDVTSASNTLLADLDYARSEAVSRGTYVSICPSTNGSTCTTSTTYDTGWLIYTYSSSPVVGTAYNNTKSSRRKTLPSSPSVRRVK